MTNDPSKFGIKTNYNGVQMRSRLESNVAYLLDVLDMEWKYEPESFLLNGGIHYMPDFYLPNHDQWIEAKGVMKAEDREKIEKFADQKKQSIIVIQSNQAEFYERHDAWADQHSETIGLNKCRNCGSFSFINYIGWYGCRVCGTHNGDHDVATYDLYRDLRKYADTKQTIKADVIEEWVDHRE